MFLRRTPYGYHNKEAIQQELQQAGFSKLECETIARRSRASSPSQPAIGFCQGTPLRGEIEAKVLAAFRKQQMRRLRLSQHGLALVRSTAKSKLTSFWLIASIPSLREVRFWHIAD